MKGKYLIGLMIMVLSLTVTLQAKNIGQNTGSPSSFNRVNITRELRSARKEYDQLVEELNQLEGRLKEYQDQDDNTLKAVNNLSADLHQYQILSGYKTVAGPGVTITLKESHYYPESEEAKGYLLYNYDLIVALVNELNSAGAEAISINGVRYTGNTEVYYTAKELTVNNTPIKAPIIIDAIGNPQTIESVLNMRFRVAWHLKENKSIQLEIITKNHLIIPGNEAIPNYQYQYTRSQEEA